MIINEDDYFICIVCKKLRPNKEQAYEECDGDIVCANCCCRPWKKGIRK